MPDDDSGGEEAALVPADDILFSLPSICDDLPAVAGPGADGALEILEDDWRQVELVEVGLSGVIESEFAAIRTVYGQHARGGAGGFITGFDAIRVRTEPARPLTGPVSLRRVLSLLPPGRPCAGVAFAEATGVAAGSFAVSFGPYSLYGLADGDAVTVLGLDGQPAADPPVGLIRGLQDVLEAFDLVLVDWCDCAVIGPAGVAGYLS